MGRLKSIPAFQFYIFTNVWQRRSTCIIHMHIYWLFCCSVSIRENICLVTVTGHTQVQINLNSWIQFTAETNGNGCLSGYDNSNAYLCNELFPLFSPYYSQSNWMQNHRIFTNRKIFLCQVHHHSRRRRYLTQRNNMKSANIRICFVGILIA